jgi:hypothetical protein
MLITTLLFAWGAQLFLYSDFGDVLRLPSMLLRPNTIGPNKLVGRTAQDGRCTSEKRRCLCLYVAIAALVGQPLCITTVSPWRWKVSCVLLLGGMPIGQVLQVRME